VKKYEKVRKVKKSRDEKSTSEKLIQLESLEAGKKRAYNRTISKLHSTNAAWFGSNAK